MLTSEMVAQAARSASVSAPGLDAWTIPEVKALPSTSVGSSSRDHEKKS